MVKPKKIAKWLESHYDKTESGTRCRYCGKDYDPRAANHDKVVHLYKCERKTNQEYEKEWKHDTSHFVWKYFKKEDIFGAKCKKCPKLFPAGYHNEELYKHIYRNHRPIITAAQEKITSSWMSEYFTISEYNAICKRCQQTRPKKINLLDEREVLVHHLHTKHILKKPNIRDSNVEMQQQSADEGNSAGPSSRHDNTRSDSLQVLPPVTTLKNPFQTQWGDFNYQSKEKRWVYTVKTTQQSVDKGNIDDPNFHHNETSLDDSFRLLASTSTQNFIQENQMSDFNYQSEEKRWVYIVQTTQQSVDKGNINDPSFHHDETSLDDSFRLLASTSTENFIQENQMRCETRDNYVEKLQQSVDEENVAGPYSHHDDMF